MISKSGGEYIRGRLTLGSLFDGSGGFPLAAVKVGIEPVWASEIEPFPIRVTKKHFPNMKHLGDIRKVHGWEIEPVDIMSGSSPCQNLSSAGDKTGLQGKSSGLFFEMIRVIREMREATQNKFPTFVIWENVRGALVRKKGDVFSEIIKEFCQTGGQYHSCTRPETWRSAGSVLGRDYSFAWRVFDSQYWGVPAMRKRVYAVGYYGTNRGGGITHIQPLQEYSLTPGMARYLVEALKKKHRRLPQPLMEAIDKAM